MTFLVTGDLSVVDLDTNAAVIQWSEYVLDGSASIRLELIVRPDT